MNKGILKDAVLLFFITLVAGFALGLVHEITLKPIAAAQLAAATATYQEVYADAAEFRLNDSLTAAVESSAEEIAGQGYGNVSVDAVQEALDGSGNVIGYLINSTSNDGYGGAVKISVGITAEGTITGVGFLELSETAGLGMNADKPEFKGQFAGKDVQTFSVTKTAASSDDQIEAISGATITSSAVTGAVNAAVYFVQNCIAE